MIHALTAIALVLTAVPHAQTALHALPLAQASITEPVSETVETEEMTVPGDALLPAEPTIEEVAEEAVTELETTTETLIAPPVFENETPVTVEPTPLVRELTAEEKASHMEAARTALTSVSSAKGSFTQINPDGTLMTGSFALRRPGRIRFEYDPPSAVLLASDGTNLAIVDGELETIDRVPLGSTPLAMILDDDLQFDDEVIVQDVTERNGLVGVTLLDGTGEMEGTLTLLFAAEGFDFLGWEAVDGNLDTTLFYLSEVETGVRVDPALFIVRDPRDEEDER